MNLSILELSEEEKREICEYVFFLTDCEDYLIKLSKYPYHYGGKRLNINGLLIIEKEGLERIEINIFDNNVKMGEVCICPLFFFRTRSNKARNKHEIKAKLNSEIHKLINGKEVQK